MNLRANLSQTMDLRTAAKGRCLRHVLLLMRCATGLTLPFGGVP